MDSGTDASPRFSAASRLILAASLALILLDIGQTLYRFRVTTDGWNWDTGSYGGQEDNILIYKSNLVGAPSPLQPGDRVLTIGGWPSLPDALYPNSKAAVALANVRDEVNVERLGEHLMRAVEEAMQPGSVSLWINSTREKR